MSVYKCIYIRYIYIIHVYACDVCIYIVYMYIHICTYMYIYNIYICIYTYIYKLRIRTLFTQCEYQVLQSCSRSYLEN